MTQQYFYSEKDKLTYQLIYRHDANGNIMRIALQLDSTESAMLACKDIAGWEPVAEEDVGIIDEWYANLETNDWDDYEFFDHEDYLASQRPKVSLKDMLAGLKSTEATEINFQRAEDILAMIRNSQNKK